MNSATPQPYASKILAGKRILITRPREQAADLEQRLRELGAIPLAFPTIRIVAPTDHYAALDAALRQLSTFDWAVFTSVNGVHHVWQRLQALDLDAQAFASVRVAAIGPATAQALVVRGVQVAAMPDRYVAEALLDVIPNPAGQRFLLPRADLARETLRTGLRAAGADVIEVPAYHTARHEPTPEALAALDAGVDILTFTSSSTVRHFVDQVGQERARALSAQALVVAIGPITANTADELGLDIDAVAVEYTVAGLVDALVMACCAS